jgi:hypothetical protein
MKKIAAILFALLFAFSVAAQDSPKFAEQIDQMRSAEKNIPPSARAIYGLNSKRRAALIAESENQLLSNNRDRILPAANYFAQYAEFLKDDETGLARIFPDVNCDKGKVVSVTELERCANMIPLRGNASFYSFRNKTNLNENGKWADIQFSDGKFVVGSKTVFGIISEIGDVSLEDVTLKSGALDFLKEYEPKTKVSKVKEETMAFETGVSENGFTYALAAPLKLNSVYVLRSVAYRLKEDDEDLLDNRLDIIVAFKVVAEEKDGSLILLWKELKSKYSRPLKDK